MRGPMRNLRPLIRRAVLATAILGTSLLGRTRPAPAVPANAPALSETLRWLTAAPRFEAEYDFDLTVDIRLLLFWTSKDDVGGGYIKLGHAASDNSLEMIRLLFGSDPAKARGINRWGAGTEVARRGPQGAVESSAFFGFMKSSQGESAGAMQQELTSEKAQGQHRFEAVISRVDSGSAFSTTVPFYSDHDFDYRDLEAAEHAVLDEIQEDPARKVHTLDGAADACDRSNGFLSTVQDLAQEAGARTRTPVSQCYIYNSKQYTLTIDSSRTVAEKTIQTTPAGTKQKVVRTYHDLEEARFLVLNHATGKKTYFSLLLGTTGSLRGAPVQIDYQPNWWFRIILNLRPPADEAAKRF
jgi:hypothetical protein